MTYEANKVSLVRYKGHLTRIRSQMDEAAQLLDLKRVNETSQYTQGKNSGKVEQNHGTFRKHGRA